MDLFDDEEKQEKPIMDKEPIGTKIEDKESLEYKKNKNQKILFTVVAVITVLVLIGSSITIGIVIGGNIGIGKDMPMLVEAYELVKKYYYKDISWEQFQQLATAQTVSAVDPFTFIMGTTQAGKGKLGVYLTESINHEHFISFILPGSGSDGAKAIKRVGQLSPYHEETIEKEEDKLPLEEGDEIYSIFVNGAWRKVRGTDSYVLGNYINQVEGSMIKIRVVKRSQPPVKIGEDRYALNEETFLYEYYVPIKDYEDKMAYYFSPSEIATDGERKDVAYIKLVRFGGNAAIDFYNCVQEFLTDEEHPSKLILDLRNNGGGDDLILRFILNFLIASDDRAKVLEETYNEGYGKMAERTLYTEDSYQVGSITLESKYIGKTIPHFEVNILANGGSASSSEVVIGDLLYYNDSKLIGTTTFGKGVGQKVFPINGGQQLLAITNGYYYLPGRDENGQDIMYNIHGKGISPKEENIILYRDGPLKKDKYIRRALQLFRN